MEAMDDEDRVKWWRNKVYNRTSGSLKGDLYVEGVDRYLLGRRKAVLHHQEEGQPWRSDLPRPPREAQEGISEEPEQRNCKPPQLRCHHDPQRQGVSGIPEEVPRVRPRQPVRGPLEADWRPGGSSRDVEPGRVRDGRQQRGRTQVALVRSGMA